MKILFINLPYHGHVIPTIGLVRELIKRGNQVTYLMPFDWQKEVAASGAKFAGYENHKKLSEQIKNAYVTAEQIIDGFDLVIYEQFFFLGKHLADKYDKPVVRIFTAPVTNEKLMQEYISADGPLKIFRHKWIGRSWTREIAGQLNVNLKTDCWLDEIVKNPPDLNLVYTLEEYQPYREDFPKEQYKFLGASIYDRPEGAFQITKSENPVIYISLGTVVKGAVSFFRKCIRAFQDEDVTVIMSVGRNFDIKKLGVLPANFYVYNSVPQLSVLKMADVFVTHGGMNSVSEAMYYGVSMVAIPFMTDQPVNARRIEELGLGRQLSYKKISSDALKEVVFSIMKDSVILKNVAAMQKKIAECPSNQGGAEYIMDYYERVKGIMKSL